MSQPLGIIVDQNPNPNSSDAWGLVLNGFCVNIILASYNDILHIYKSYDYCVDTTISKQPASPGDTYNASLDQSIRPPAPPINWVTNVQADFVTVVEDLQQIVVDASSQGGNLNTAQIQAAYAAMLSDTQSTFTLNQLALMNAVLTYVEGGG
jgi:hypothetical protein